jgi:hypothetical protein
MDHDEYEAGKFRHRAFITRRPELSLEIEGLISRLQAIDTNIGGSELETRQRAAQRGA